MSLLCCSVQHERRDEGLYSQRKGSRASHELLASVVPPQGFCVPESLLVVLLE